jgi:hypothetical protein
VVYARAWHASVVLMILKKRGLVSLTVSLQMTVLNKANAMTVTAKMKISRTINVLGAIAQLIQNASLASVIFTTALFRRRIRAYAPKTHVKDVVFALEVNVIEESSVNIMVALLTLIILLVQRSVLDASASLKDIQD